MNTIISLLNNPSVAAFVGAFSAFFLVALTDWRRKNSRKRLLVKRLKILKVIAQAKLETAQTSIEMIRNNRFSSAPVMEFPSDFRVMQREAFNVLSSTQINAIDALIYWMESIDGIFERARIIAEELHVLSKNEAPTQQRSQKGEELINEFQQAETNLGHFVTMASMYINKEPEKILEYRVKHSD